MKVQVHIGLLAAVVIASTAISALPACAQQQAPAVQGVVEQYFLDQNSPGNQGAGLELRYVNATAQVSNSVQLVGGTLTYDGGTALDENYARVTGLGGQWRIGRFRTEFGHSDWAELYYDGLPQQPLIRQGGYASSPGLPLDRVDTGVDYVTNTGVWQFQAAAIDPYSGSYQLGPHTWDHVALRAQTYVGGWILGVSSLNSTRSNVMDGGSSGLYDVDWRWTAPAFQIRGEALTSVVGSIKANGYYADFDYHTLAAPHTTFIVRQEGMSYPAWPTWTTSALSIGVRQTVTPHVSLELSQCWANHSPYAYEVRGTVLQLVTSTPF